jgi:hypothetical protein
MQVVGWTKEDAGTWCICQNPIYIEVELSMLASITDGMQRTQTGSNRMNASSCHA